MSKSYYLFSTLTASVAYSKWEAGGGDIPRMVGSVVVEGGANVAAKNFDTPRGVVTNISEEDLKLISEDSVFKRHLARGYITVEDANGSPAEVAENMTKGDKSAPLTDADFAPDKAPVSAGAVPPPPPKLKK